MNQQLSKPCNLLSWNIRSVLNEERLDNVLQFMDDHKIGIACLCETWFDAEKGRFTARIQEAGYEITHAYREDKRGGGAAILYQKKLKVKPGDKSATRYTSFEFAYCYIQLEKMKVILLCIYRLQDVPCSTFCSEYEKLMDTIFHKGEVVIVVGDFNVWYEVQNNPDTKKLIS